MAKIFEKGSAKYMAERVIQVASLVLSAVVLAETLQFLKDSGVPMEVPTFGLSDEWAESLEPWVIVPVIGAAFYAQHTLYWNIYERYGRPNG